MESVFQKEFEICSYDIDFKHDVKTSKLFGFYMEVAWLHAHQLKYGFYDLLENYNAIGALSRMRMKILKYPKWNDKVTFKTWPVQANRLFSRHDFEISMNGEVCGYGSSDWIMAHAQNRTLLRPSVVMDKLPFEFEQQIPNFSTQRIRPEVKGWDAIYRRQTKYNDLDVNRHLNSIRYLDWALDCLSSDWLQNKRITDLNINYMHEIYAENEVDIKYKLLCNNPYTYQFVGNNVNTNETSFLMNIVFE